jgi:hypothetical protein|nr:MAG TPA: hypothetical protein [Caudoviricetes sp.]
MLKIIHLSSSLEAPRSNKAGFLVSKAFRLRCDELYYMV